MNLDLSKSFHPYPKKFSQPKLPRAVKKVSDKNKDPNTGFRKATGELTLFRQIFKEQHGLCMVTNKPVDFHPDCFMHVLSGKGGVAAAFRTYKKNILFVNPRIHHLYDNCGMEALLKEFPEAKWIYDLKEELKIELHNQPTV